MPILVVGALLVLYGIFAIYSVSIFESFQLTLRQFNDPSNYFYFLRQLRHLLIAIVLAIAIYYLPLKVIKENRGKIFIFSLLFLLLVFTPLGLELKGAKGWLHIPGFGSVQPGEFVKLAFVIFFSGWLVKKQKMLPSLQGYIALIVVIGISLFLFLLIPDLGTLLVLGPVALILYIFAGGNKRYVLVSIILALIFTFTIGMQFHYVKKRIEYFINPDVDKTVQGIGYQTRQGLIAIGAGGFFGKGYGKGLQKFGYIPEAQSDFIFSAYSEEVGLLGDSVLLLLYFLLAYFTIKRLVYVKDVYYKYLAVGILSLIIWQAFVNIGVNTKIIPLTGLTLPFVSYGGTALMVNIIELVLLYKILYQKGAIKIEKNTPWKRD